MNIKQLRLKHHLSQQELSTKTGIPRPRLAKWEEGKAKPKREDYDILEKFFATLGEVSRKPAVLKEPEAYYDSRTSLEISLQNLTEDKLRNTAIMEKLAEECMVGALWSKLRRPAR